MGSNSIGREFIKKLKKAPADYDRLADDDIRAFEVVEIPRGVAASKRVEDKT